MNMKDFISKIRVKDISDIDFSNANADSVYIFADAYKTFYHKKAVLAYRLYLYIKDEDIFFPVISGIVQREKCISEYVEWKNDGTTTTVLSKRDVRDLLAFVLYDISRHYHKNTNTNCVYIDIADIPNMEPEHCINESKIIGIIADAQREARKNRVLRFYEKCRSYMKDMPKMSDSFNIWLKYSFMPSSRYFFYRYQNKKMIQGICSVCGSAVTLPKGINGSTGICPVCKREITYRSVKRRRTASDYEYVIYVQRAKCTIYLRMFTVTKSFEKLHQRIRLHECYRIVIQRNNAYCFYPTTNEYDSGIVWRIVTDGAAQNALNWLAASHDCDIYMPSGVKIFNGFYVEEYLKRIYTNTRERKKISTTLRQLILVVSDWRVESLIKMGCERDVVHWSTEHVHNLTLFQKRRHKKLHQELGIKKQYLQVLCSQTDGRDILNQLQSLSKIPQTIEVMALIEMMNRRIPIHAMYTVNRMGMDAYDNYLTFQMKGQENQDRNYWHSMLNTYQERIGQMPQFTEKERKALLFPSDLRTAYEQVRLHKVPKLDDARMRRLFSESQKRYGYSNGKFTVIAPKTIDDVDYEGTTLTHCIVQHLKSVAKGDTSILFIRKSQDLTVPFYTMECRGKEVLQCRGFDNKAPTAEVAEFLKEYKNYLITGGKVS